MAKQVSLLVVALDAGLREAAFECLTSAGYRVDAVGDLASARRRLSKDEYALIVRSRELEPVTGAEQGQVKEVDFDASCVGDALEKQVRDALEGS